MVKFRIGDRSFGANELVYHSGRRKFGTVNGVSGGSVLIHFDGLGECPATPELVRQNVKAEWQLARELITVDAGLRTWFLEAMCEGETAAGARQRLRAAADLSGRG